MFFICVLHKGIIIFRGLRHQKGYKPLVSKMLLYILLSIFDFFILGY